MFSEMDAHDMDIGFCGPACESNHKKSEILKKSRLRGSGMHKIRKFVIARDFGRCLACGSQKKLELAHIIPFKMQEKNNARNLVTLCVRCHDKFDNITPKQLADKVISYISSLYRIDGAELSGEFENKRKIILCQSCGLIYHHAWAKNCSFCRGIVGSRI